MAGMQLSESGTGEYMVALLQRLNLRPGSGLIAWVVGERRLIRA
jgi:hypothetical protein